MYCNTNTVLQNKRGDNLLLTEKSNGHALYRVLDSDAYFITKIELKTDEFNIREHHLDGGKDWENKGQYANGKDKAKDIYKKLTDPAYASQVERNDYYSKL